MNLMPTMFMRLQHRVVISEQVLIRAHAQQRWREWCFKIACVIERACECVFALYADTYTRTHTSHITHTHHTHTHTHTHTHNAATEEASFAADKAKIITEFFPEGNKTVQVRWGPGKE